MNCPSCSIPVEGQFCSRCGIRVAPTAGYQYQAVPPPAPAYAAPGQPYAYPPIPYVPRVQSHLKSLGTLWYIYAAYRALVGFAVFIFLLGFKNSGFFDRFNPDHDFPFHSIAPMMGGIALMVLVLAIGGAALACFTGHSLMYRKPWGRTLAIVAAVLALIKFPFGTALGVYTLWVLMPGQSRVEYEAMADRA